MFASLPTLPRHVFEEAYAGSTQHAALVFSQPGVERQDSVFNGFQVGGGSVGGGRWRRGLGWRWSWAEL